MIEKVLLSICSALVIASICWLVREVLSIRNKLVQLETSTSLQISQITSNCERHQKWSEQMQGSLHRIDRNVVAICATQGIDHEKPTDGETKF